MTRLRMFNRPWKPPLMQQCLQFTSTESCNTSRTGPLHGVRVIDASRVLAGPFCSQILADYGADVIKIEQPGTGDETRHWKSDAEAARWRSKTMSMYYASINRNKRSMTLNLKEPKSQTIVRDLVRTADVFIENFIPGKADKLGLGYDALSKVNPSLVYASLSGYGSTGPYALRAGYDAIAAAEGGLMHITGHPSGTPVRPGLGMTDMSTGLFMHGAILAALLARANDPRRRGQHLSGSLFETQLALLINVGTLHLNTGVEPTRWGAAHPSIVPYNTYQTSDGRWLALGANNDRQFATLWKRLKRLDLVDDERYSTNAKRVTHREELDEAVASSIQSATLAEWNSRLAGSGLAYGPVNTVGEALRHPQAQHREMTQEMACADWDADGPAAGRLRFIGPPVKFSGHKVTVRNPAPGLGQHTDDILREMGYSDAEIRTLRGQNVV